jgi:RNA polymerase sigma factor for flagellar operon FliA
MEAPVPGAESAGATESAGDAEGVEDVEGAEEGINEGPLWPRMRAGDDAARQALLQRHLPYARTVAATYYARRSHDDIAFDDYLQLARLGLIEALARFEPGRGAGFRTFAARHMHGALLAGLERLTEKNQQIAVLNRLRKERLEDVKAAASSAKSAAPSAQRQRAMTQHTTRQTGQELFDYLAEIGIGLALGIMLEDTGMVDADAFGIPGHGVSPDVQYFRRTQLQEMQRLVAELVKQLSPQAQAVIRLHYLQEMPFAQIAQEMALTPGRISQIHRQALAQLRERLRPSQGLDLAG